MTHPPLFYVFTAIFSRLNYQRIKTKSLSLSLTCSSPFTLPVMTLFDHEVSPLDTVSIWRFVQVDPKPVNSCLSRKSL